MSFSRILPFFLLMLPLGLACRMHDTGVTVQTLKDENAPTSESWNTSMQIMENGRQRLTMNAEYMARWETPDSTWMILSGADEQVGRVTVIIFDAEGDTSAVVTSQQITYNERARHFEARGDVQVVSGPDRSVQSEHLSWSELTARVTTPGFATITTPTEQLSGYGLDADENLADFSLARVSGTVLVQDE